MRSRCYVSRGTSFEFESLRQRVRANLSQKKISNIGVPRLNSVDWLFQVRDFSGEKPTLKDGVEMKKVAFLAAKAFFRDRASRVSESPHT